MLNEEELQKLEEESDIRIAGIYREYCRQMRAQNLMDYDDENGSWTSGVFSEIVSVYLCR